MVPLAVAAREVMLEKHLVAFLESLVLRKQAAHLRKGADVLVTHDQRTAAQWQLVLADVGAADAGHLYFHERRVPRNVRQIEFAQLRRCWSNLQRGQQFLRHVETSRSG